MCTLDRNLTERQDCQQPAAILCLQLLAKHDGTSAGLTGKVVLQDSREATAHVLLKNTGGDFQEQSATKFHLAVQDSGEDAVGDVGEDYS